MASIEILTREDVRALIREELRGRRGTFSQNDGERPVGCGREKFLRVWRALHAAHDPGATAEGRARILTTDAWARFVSNEKPLKPRLLELVPQERSRADRVLDALGGKRK